MKTSSGESTVPRIPVQTPPELLSPRASTAAPGNATPAPSSEEAVSLGLAKNGLFRFFRDGISSSTWNVFDSCDRMRVVYVGTDVSNMTHLIRLNKPNSSCLVLPFPQIHPPHLWKSSAVQGGIATETVQDVISFPAKDVRDSLVDAYFAAINPFFPVVDEAAFRDRYRTMDSQSPLMLLHAVLLAGAHVSTHPRVVPARYMLKATLFRRAKHLFDMRHENDRVHLVQTALLFTWHLQNGDTASANAYYWTGVACRIAFGIGMHRNLSVASINPHANNMPAEDRRHWRRVWWTLFQVDALSALEHGRPPMIRFEDFDQEPLVMDDFIESNGVLNASLDFDYCTQNIGLCHIILDILALSAPRVSRKSPLAAQASLLNSRLASWMLNLPSSISSETFADLNLRLHYHTAVLHLYRLISDDVACPDRVKREAWSVVGGATSAIVSAFEVIRMRDMVGHCHFTALVALTAAAIHTSKEIQRQLGDSGIMAALNDLHLLDRVCLAAEHLSEYWPNAEGVRKVFRSLLDKFTAIVRSIQEPSDVTLPDASIGSEMTAVNWSDILESSWHQETTWEADACWNTGIF
ncbi:membrane transporter protein [Purpureocillium lavendulum]|uniref:Membrane transporter protein n=1 Tax=Purpureocillium lavendulum TaxID=1247861 RepID=A0AB34G352_9HYPO|nr:membrane transporter protein [Purpureocillium lavendulum]